MQGILIDKNGNEYTLGKILSWDICHGMGEACDFFELNALYSPDMLTELGKATRFRAKNGSSTVFYGVVDEYIVSISEKGATVSINGRSLAALLMDNEVEDGTRFVMSKSDILDDVVTPFGISSIAPATMPDVAIFPINRGDSAWSVLKRFCLRSTHTEPRFTRAGKLILTETTGSTVTINADTEASSIKYKDERYGVISKITVKNRATGGSYTLKNQPFLNRGGSSRRYYYTDKFAHIVSNPEQAHDRFTGEYQLRQSERGKHCIELTVHRQFACFPGDTVSLSSTALGISGSYPVTQTHCWADAVSSGTRITLEV